MLVQILPCFLLFYIITNPLLQELGLASFLMTQDNA